MVVKSDISGFILAGGKSHRMGINKALLLVQDEPLLNRMIRLIRPFCKTVAISGQNDDYNGFNIDMVPDLYTDCGPISGIVSSLSYSSTEWNLLVSVDVPFINTELIQHLITHIGQYDCVIPVHEGGIEPLIALYNRKILSVIEEMISQGDYKLMRLLSKINTLKVDCNSLTKQYPRLFFNVNYPEDYNSI